MSVPLWGWFAAVGLILVLLVVDIVVNRGNVEPTIRRALVASARSSPRRSAVFANVCNLVSSIAKMIAPYSRTSASTAPALNVHRNTLKYRLQRIEQITGNDLSDPDTTCNLQLATRARNTLSALRAHK
jgi:hypothetical protein